jgi:hypothetical protein
MALNLEEELQLETTSTGNHDVFAHYVEQDLIADAVIYGWPLVALCGKIWVPFRDPEKYPICPICLAILSADDQAPGA